MNRSQYYEHERPEVLEAIPLDAMRVLDVGCGSGWLGEQLKRRQGATVWGIEVVQEAAERAASRLDRVWNTSVEQALAEIPVESLDCIVTADVLEHLIDPWAVLTELGKRLVPGGTVVASLPNVGHWDVVRNLLEGTWPYTEEGLLDRTHLRFFTRRTARELFWTAGLAVRELTAIRRLPVEVPSTVMAGLQKAGLRVARLREEAQAFQYRLVAERRDPPRPWPRVGIIVLSPSGPDDTLECLASLGQLTYAPFDVVVVVVDGGPTTGSTDAILARFPEVAVLRAAGNTDGANLGIRHALDRGAEYVLLLSNRITVDQTLLVRMMETATLSPEAGLWGPRICYYSRPETVWSTGLNWDQEQLDFVIQSQGENAGAGDTVHTVDALMGCAILVRREVLERVGPVDPEYRSRWGETDFCSRAVGEGFGCVVVPAALARLKVEAAVEKKRSALDEYFETRDRLRWTRRHGRSGQLGSLRRRILREAWTMLPPWPGWAAGHRKLYWWSCGVTRVARNPILGGRLRALFDDLSRRSGTK